MVLNTITNFKYLLSIIIPGKTHHMGIIRNTPDCFA